MDVMTDFMQVGRCGKMIFEGTKKFEWLVGGEDG
jgi:hypothetical protein